MIDGIGKDSDIVENAKGGKQSKIPYRFDLIPPKALFSLAKVFEYGADKYELNNWHKIPRHDHINHLEAHLQAYKAGDESDDHINHMLCRAVMAVAMPEDNFPYGDKK